MARMPTAKRTGESAESRAHRFTPLKWWLERFGSKRVYTLDPFAHDRAPVSQYIHDNGGRACIGVGGLDASWIGHTVFANPSYTDEDIRDAVTKAYATMFYAVKWNRPTHIDMLLPAWVDRQWWLDLIEKNRDDADRGPAEVCFTSFWGRINFGTPKVPDVDAAMAAWREAMAAWKLKPRGKKPVRPWKSQPGWGVMTLRWVYPRP